VGDDAAVGDDESGVVTAGRIGLAVVVVLGMWFVAFVLAIVSLMTVGCGPDATGLECDETFTPIALGISAVLFLGSGFVGWFVSGRRWMVAAPIAAVVVSTVWGVAVALL
jgi:hypothetical protein